MTIANTSNHLFVSLTERDALMNARQNLNTALKFLSRSGNSSSLARGTSCFREKIIEQIRNLPAEQAKTLKSLKQSDR